MDPSLAHGEPVPHLLNECFTADYHLLIIYSNIGLQNLPRQLSTKPCAEQVFQAHLPTIGDCPGEVALKVLDVPDSVYNDCTLVEVTILLLLPTQGDVDPHNKYCRIIARIFANIDFSDGASQLLAIQTL